MGSIRALAALFRYRSIRALAALFRYRSIRALCRPIGKADTGSGYGYVLTALRAYASAAAAIGMRQYAAFFAAQTSTHIESFAPLAQTQTKTRLT